MLVITVLAKSENFVLNKIQGKREKQILKVTKEKDQCKEIVPSGYNGCVYEHTETVTASIGQHWFKFDAVLAVRGGVDQSVESY